MQSVAVISRLLTRGSSKVYTSTNSDKICKSFFSTESRFTELTEDYHNTVDDDRRKRSSSINTIPVKFPRHLSDLDSIANNTLHAGTDLSCPDHPGFCDEVYRRRREELAELARSYHWDESIPRINYTNDESNTWRTVWERMEPLLDKYACREYLESFQKMKEYCGYTSDSIPQAQDITAYLQNTTNFRLRPVAGLLSSRDFLNGLAFRVFFSTQYIRHHSKPLYTPEPDICHELLGHAPMFANSYFADFSQEIGLASLGASDDDILKLARCYWYSVEFGLCKQQDESEGDNEKTSTVTTSIKAYGAGLLSSFGELEYACAGYSSHDEQQQRPEYREWDPTYAAEIDYPITRYQPVYFVAESLQDATEKMREFCDNSLERRPFFPSYDSKSGWMHTDIFFPQSQGL